MAVLRHVRTGRHLSLPPHCRVGRSPDADLHLADAGVSGEHALLSWRPEGWLLRDTGSRNGTTVDGVRVPAGGRVVISVGAVLRFGVDDATWTVLDVGPPGPAAVGPDGRLRVAVGGLLALPDDADPSLVVYAGATRWILEAAEGEEDAPPDGMIGVKGERWRLLLPVRVGAAEVASTWEESRPPELGVQIGFVVSRDEEHVDVEVEHGGGRVRLAPRAHHFLTLTLARAVLEDEAEGVAAPERGWRYVDDLGAMLRIDQAYLNLQLFRARQQLAEAGVEVAGAVFERRRLSRQVRLRVAGVRVQTG